MLYLRGQLQEAEQWFRRAAEAGDTDAMNNIGVVLEQREQLLEAEQWHRRAIDAGDNEAIDDVRLLLE